MYLHDDDGVGTPHFVANVLCSRRFNNRLYDANLMVWPLDLTGVMRPQRVSRSAKPAPKTVQPAPVPTTRSAWQRRQLLPQPRARQTPTTTAAPATSVSPSQTRQSCRSRSSCVTPRAKRLDSLSACLRTCCTLHRERNNNLAARRNRYPGDIELEFECFVRPTMYPTFAMYIYKSKKAVTNKTPPLANFSIGEIEKTRFHDAINALVFHGQCVGNIFRLVDGTTDIDDLVRKFNSAHSSPNSTAESDADNEIAFLDVLLHKQEDGSMQRRVFRKKTWT
nr:unnamed protein product [Spirometra erinaceieuropaei]